MIYILPILISAAALAGVLGMMKKGWQTGTISIRFSAASIHFSRSKSPIAFWIAWCVEGFMALTFLGWIVLDGYMALHAPVIPPLPAKSIGTKHKTGESKE